MELVEGFIKSLVLLFLIMDPFASLPVFLSLTKSMKPKQVASSADNAIMVAGTLLFTFLFFGSSILSLFGVSFSSFQIAGGIVLLLMSLELVLGLKLAQKGVKKAHVAVVVIGTPLLTGPGVITSVIILNQQFGLAPVIAASIGALAAAWLILRHGEAIRKALGDAAVEAVSKIIGLLLAASAVELVRQGLVGG